MLKWLANLTRKSDARVKPRRTVHKSRILDRIKAELAGISNRVSDHALRVESNSAAIENIQKQVASINETVGRLSATLEKAQATLPPASPAQVPALDAEEFTHMQEATLIVLWKLADKDSGQWISMKTLVKSIYPEQDYNRVRTTIFEYIRIFEELGLIQRIKRGNRTFLALTNKGVETAKKRLTSRKEKYAQPAELEASTTYLNT
ncbi:MAG: hypothetical protein UY62_C0012G0004 [Parcubacteria group bacterium GW2011_GWF2_50_9]|nr:MAG: hypothetical protein UY62_C0012G0004 [Parcubacteria group bacterium GW2011_GWF2_50_9]